MNTDSKAARAGREPTDDKSGKTPSADMQAEDAGTASSGASDATTQGTAAEAAMKQTSKTEHEAGGPQ